MQRMKTISSHLASFQKKALCLAVVAAFSQTALANPLNPTVAAGSATFDTNGNTLTVTNTPNAIINWQQFNIGQNETTRFVQQSAQSAVLNRIGGQDASQILGTLQSNGRVFLINPNGVMFGQGAVIDVAGLVASSLNLSDANFLASKLNFDGGGFGAVTNLGTISTPLGGTVYLIGNNVSNQGVITTPQGQVLLAAGSSVSLIDTAGPELSVTLTANGNKAVNIGTVNAEGGRIDMFGAIIEQRGVLRANAATVDDAGRIVLKASDKAIVSGEISATNSVGKGGQVQVLGNEVTLTSTAKIDVSGVGAGGTALIGGDYKGGNTAIQNAQLTTVAAGATIKADALGNGNGGKVIVWADDKTIFDGYIYARGGADGGDGGFVETSGKNILSVGGGVNTLAPKGATGNWLLDPASYCFEDSIGSCAAATNLTSANVATALNSSDMTYSATDYIKILSLNLGNGLTRWDARLELEAPTIEQTGNITTYSTPGDKNLHLKMIASGTSTTYASDSGKIILANGSNITLGGNVNGNLHLQASNEIKFLGASFLTVSTAVSGGDIILAAPKIVLDGNVQVRAGLVTGNGESGVLGVVTDRLSSTGVFTGETNFLGINTYTSGKNIYLGLPNSDPACDGLCITNQFSYPGLAARTTGLMAASPLAAVDPGDLGTITDWNATIQNVLTKWSPPTGDIFIGYSHSWNIASKDSLGMVARNITINSGRYINGSGWSGSASDYVLGLVASNTFTNLGDGIINMPTDKRWGIAVGNLPGSTFGTFANGALNLTLSAAATGPNALARGNPNFIIDMNLTTSDGLCALNPSACLVQDPFKNDQYSSFGAQDIMNIGSNAVGALTISGDLKLVEGQITEKTATVASDEKAGQASAAGKKDKAKQEEEKKKVAVARQESKAAEEKKSPAELKREAQTLKADAKKSEGEARKIEAEARKIEAEAKKSETETKKVEAEAKKVEAVAKKAEETGKKAEAEAKKHDGEAKQAANEAKEAKSPVAKAGAEARQAEAEGKKAKAESKKVEAEERKIIAESKKSEVEHKKAETESKHKEAETKRIEAESKKAKAESKQAEAESKLALATAKEAETPQHKQAAERRSEEKRVEAIQKKAEANVKQEQAEAKKTEVEAKKAESEYKKTEAEAKNTEADSKRAEGNSKKFEANAMKAKSEGKKAEADSAKAKQTGKGDDQKKAEVKKVDAEKKQIEQEKKAEAKKVEAGKKQAEADGKKREAEQKKARAEEKKLVAEKKQAERREREVKSFARAAVASMVPERLAEVIAMRHEYKTESMKPALSVLERNPAAANLPACGSGGGDVCAPAKPATTQQVAQQIAQIPAPRIPKVSFLPQIERKIAIVVAINHYKDKAIPPLESAVPDGEAVGKLMQDRLGYDVRVIRDAGKADIVKALNAVGREVGPNDSVTVYYAGHGYQMDGKSGGPGEGYWIPADGSTKEPSNWISNSDVSKLLANIPAKQVMLVSDSCYSGSFTKEQKITAPVSADPAQILARRSVVVMSSGGEEPVSDEGKEGHSIFAWSLMNSMKKIDKFDSGSNLYGGIRKQVIEEFPQVPQYGAATSAGHVQGGDYLFEVRRY